jgi:hypothetical protein
VIATLDAASARGLGIPVNDCAGGKRRRSSVGAIPFVFAGSSGSAERKAGPRSNFKARGYGVIALRLVARCLQRGAGLCRALYTGTTAAMQGSRCPERHEACGLVVRPVWHRFEQAVAFVGGDGSADVESLRKVAA